MRRRSTANSSKRKPTARRDSPRLRRRPLRSQQARRPVVGSARPAGGGAAAIPSHPPLSGRAGAAVAAKRSWLGIPYVAFQQTPQTGFDCSGQTTWTRPQAAVLIPRSSKAQYETSPHVPIDVWPQSDRRSWFGTMDELLKSASLALFNQHSSPRVPGPRPAMPAFHHRVRPRSCSPVRRAW